MKKSKLSNVIIESLTNDWANWDFNYFTAKHISGMELWIAGMPIISLSVYKPSPFTFSFIDKVRVYRALKKCLEMKLIGKLKDDRTLTPNEAMGETTAIESMYVTTNEEKQTCPACAWVQKSTNTNCPVCGWSLKPERASASIL